MDNKLLVIKYGGNAMTDQNIRDQLLQNICTLVAEGHQLILIHGGGPFIEKALQAARIESEFIDGHRVTTEEAMTHIEMALKGNVNATLVGAINRMGARAVGLSGKDGKIIVARKRYGARMVEGVQQEVDLGRVGDVEKVNEELLQILLKNNYIPVITCIASDRNGKDFNINADVFAGHIAGAMGASEFIVMTDVDGLLRDVNDRDSLINEIGVGEISQMIADGSIQGGMLPKLEACETAMGKGAKSVRIINGTKPEQLLQLAAEEPTGTLIKQDL